MQSLVRDLFAKTKLAMQNDEYDTLEREEEEAQSGKQKAAATMEPTIVQAEGWLLVRRAAGDASSSSSSPTTTSAAATSPKAADGNRNNIFTSGGDADDDASSVFTAATTTTRNRLGSMVAFLKGEDEKKRYFVLLTSPPAPPAARMRHHTLRAAGGGGGPRAELRYFRHKPSPPDNFISPQGVIPLHAGMHVVLQETGIKLVSPERVHYLRQDPAEMNPLRARTSAAQWSNAVQFALDTLLTIDVKRKTGGRFQPINSQAPPSTGTTATAAAAALPELPAEYETRRRARKSVGRREDATDHDHDHNTTSTSTADTPDDGNHHNNAFVELWELYGIEAFDVVVNHFGPVQTDLERLRAHFQSRVGQFTAEADVLQAQMGNASEVVAKEQKTVALAMRELHRTNERNLLVVRDAARELERLVCKPLEALHQEITSRLEEIATKHEAPVSYVHGARRILREADDKIVRLSTLLASSSASAAAAASPPTPSAAAAPPATPTHKMIGARRKSEAAPEKIEFDLNEARQMRRDAAKNLLTIETKSADFLTDAMTACYELEMHRFRQVAHVLDQASKLEQELERKRAKETLWEDALHQIDAQRDMRSTFAKLKAQGEKSRPQGRMRRKNSTVNRALMDLMMEEDEEEEEEAEEHAKEDATPSPDKLTL